MEKYIVPEMDVVEFENEDVITTSTCSPKSEDFGYGGGGNPSGGR